MEREKKEWKCWQKEKVDEGGTRLVLVSIETRYRGGKNCVFVRREGGLQEKQKKKGNENKTCNPQREELDPSL